MKRKILNILLALFLCFICIFILTGCGEEKTNNEVTTVNDTENSGGVSLNPELEGVCAFASKKDKDGNNSIIALKQDGTEVKILDEPKTENGLSSYGAMDYSYGKLYLQSGTEFFAIDLNKGDGNYSLESVYKLNSDIDWVWNIMYVYDGIIYFNQGEEALSSYDMRTKNLRNIDASLGDNGYFKIDKENADIYSCTNKIFRDIGGVIEKYDIKTKETTEIIREEFKSLDEEGSVRLYLGPLTDNGFIVLKNGFGEENGGQDFTKVYEYNIQTKEYKLLDQNVSYDYSVSTCVFDNNKLYYITTKGTYPMMADNLKVYNFENGEIKTIGEDYERIDRIYNLPNNKLQVQISGGQDISTDYSKTYIVDKDSLELTEVDYSFNYYDEIEEGSDNYTEETTAGENETNNNVISKEDLVGTWHLKDTNSVEYSVGMLYGTGISYSSNDIVFNEDGTYTFGIALSFSEKGNYEIQGDTIKLTNIEQIGNPSDRGPEEELKIRKEDGKYKIIFEEHPVDYSSGKAGEELTVEVRFEKE